MTDDERLPDAQHERTAPFLLAGFERRVLPRLARALPAWVVPDHLTALGLLSSTWIGVAYILSNRNPAWLWGASLGLVIQWYGDSLDGTLARVRKIERPRYGYYLDHITDAYSTAAIGIGLGLSPYMLLSIGLAVVILYLIMSINVYLETYVLGEFRLGYAVLGPTEARVAEARVALIGMNTVAIGLGPMRFDMAGTSLTLFDIFGAVGALVMLVLMLIRVGGNLRALARLEPPRRSA
jgi:phosphatidylglycerophosphate synthase